MTEFNPRCVPPWPESELWRKISEAKKHRPSRTPKGRSGQRESYSEDEDQTEAVIVRLSDVTKEPVE